MKQVLQNRKTGTTELVDAQPIAPLRRKADSLSPFLPEREKRKNIQLILPARLA